MKYELGERRTTFKTGVWEVGCEDGSWMELVHGRVQL
jgi:hypothetical protein